MAALPLTLRVFLVLLVGLEVDTLVFVNGALAGTPAYADILQGSLLVRLVLAALLAPLLGVYLRGQERRSGAPFPARPLLAVLRRSTEAERELLPTPRDVLRRRVAEAGLRESENRYRLLLEDAQDAVLVFALESDGRLGPLLSVNRSACALFGGTREQLLARPVAGLTAPDSPERLDAMGARLAAGEDVLFECELQGGDGRRVPAEIHGRRFEFRGRPAAMAIVRDISERRRSEAARFEGERRFRRLFENVPNVAVQGYDAQRRVIFWNEASEQLYGYAREEAMGRLLEDLIFPPGFAEIVIPLVADWVVHGRPIPPGEVRLRRKDGSLVDVYSSHVMLKNDRGEMEMYCLDHDLTDLRRTEQKAQQLATAIEQAAESVIITGADGVIGYVNPAFERISGYTAAEAAGRAAGFTAAEPDPAREEEILRTARAGRRWTGRFVNRRKDGGTYVEDATVSPVVDPRGEVIGCVSVQHDVSERIRLEEQHRQAQKMEAIGQLAGGVAHDFNNLLTVILSSAEFLAPVVAPRPDACADLDAIRQAGNRAAELTRQLLAFSRRQTLHRRPVDLNGVVLDAHRMLSRLIGEHIRVEIRNAPAPVLAHVDASQIGLVLMNLAINARDAMPHGGLLRIETGTVDMTAAEAAGLVESAAGHEGRYATIRVIDTGIGMSAETRRRIFDPFFTTKPVGQGTGLGLPTAYGIVCQHGGHMAVASEPGQGSCFTLYLPEEGAAEAGDPPAAAPAAPGGRETILLVEDNDDVRRVSLRMFQGLGYEVQEASCGEEALALLARPDAHVRLLVSDIVMPGLSGRELAEQARARYPGLRVLLMSGYPDARADAASAAPGEFVLPKPFTRETAARALRDALDRA